VHVFSSQFHRKEVRAILLHACSFVMGWVGCYLLLARQHESSEARCVRTLRVLLPASPLECARKRAYAESCNTTHAVTEDEQIRVSGQR
jgi:hypothetical protein